jgi:hypothetical protein
MVTLYTEMFNVQKFYVLLSEYVYVFLSRYQSMQRISSYMTLILIMINFYKSREVFTAQYELSL